MKHDNTIPKETIKKLAATGLSKSAIAAALGINEKHFEQALKADEVFGNLVNKLIMDYYLQADSAARHGCLSPELYQHWTQTKWRHFYPQNKR